MREQEAPDGCLIHSAGQSEHGWYIYDIWESQEHFQRFVEEKLRPAMESLQGAMWRPATASVLPDLDARQGAST